MDAFPTDQATVLSRVLVRMIDTIGEFNESTCFLTAQPLQEPIASVQNNLFCTVSPTSGTYDESVFVGAGEHCVIENGGIIIVVYNAMRLDRSSHDSILLTDATRGLLTLKWKIIKALAGHVLQDQEGNSILVNPMAPERAEDIRSMWERPVGLGDMALVFSTDFEWDIVS